MRSRPEPGAKRSGERGQALVEFAFTSIVFFVTIFGVFEFGRAIWQYNVVSNLATEGVRRASVCGNYSALASGDCNIQSFVSGRSLGFTVVATTTPSTLSTLQPGDVVTVQVQSTFVPAVGALLPSKTMTLQSTAKMITAR